MTGHLIGYARVSTTHQDLSAQLDALDALGCDRVFTEKVSGVKVDRPQFAAMLDHLRPGDTVIVTALDRLGRSLRELIEVGLTLKGRGIHLRSLREAIDTSSATGRLVFNIFGSLAEFERELIQERTHAGLEAARSRGRKGDRRRVMTAEKAAMARTMYDSQEQTVEQIAKALGVGRSSIYRSLNGGLCQP